LLFSARGKISPKEVKSLLSSTGKPWSNDAILMQGAGLIQAYDAVHAKTLFEPSSIALNDTDHMPDYVEVKVTNTGDQLEKFSVNSTASWTPSFYSEGTDNSKLSLDLHISPNSLQLPAGESATIKISPVKPNPNAALPFLSGYVTLEAEQNGTTLLIPYVAVGGSLYNGNYINCTVYQYVTLYHRYIWKANSTIRIGTDFPSIGLSTGLGTRIMTVDVVPAFVPNDTAVSPSGPFKWNLTTNVLGDKMLGSVDMFPQYNIPVDKAPVVAFTAKLADGRYLPAGPGMGYYLVARALKVYGDPDRREDWVVNRQGPFFLTYSS
jgi:hypothetical protein